MDIATFNSVRVPPSAKWAFTTRRVDRGDVGGILTDVTQAVSGDLVLARIIKVGQHKNIQLAEGRNSESYIGDHIVVTCGDRYAPDQFEALAELDSDSADLVAGGGLVGRMRAAHTRMAPPTQVKPIGLLVDQRGDVININRYALPYKPAPKDVTVIGVVGASMNAGKTTAAASLAHGLSRAGYPVAAIKATGTGAFGDFNAFRDAGLLAVADFTDAGMASTYRQPLDRIEQGFETLIAHVAGHGAKVVVVELADGVFQSETADLLRNSVIREALDGLLFAAPDALGALGGVTVLRQMGFEPFAVSGLVSCSPLAVAEAFAATHVPIVSRDDLRNPETVHELVQSFIATFPTRIPEDLSDLKTAA
jgi:hypothetical protein